MSQTIVITGANRGIGYDMARLWKARGNHVIAVCRSSAVKKGGEDLHDLGVRVIEGIDVSRAEDVQTLKQELGDTPVDVLYNNAGMMESETLEDMNFEVPDDLRCQCNLTNDQIRMPQPTLLDGTCIRNMGMVICHSREYMSILQGSEVR